MKAAQIVTPKKPLEIKNIKTLNQEVLKYLSKFNRLEFVISDIHLWDGGYKGPGDEFLKTTDRGVKYPLTPGHEIAGIISELGEDAKETFKNEERVMVYPWIGEGLCPACQNR